MVNNENYRMRSVVLMEKISKESIIWTGESFTRATLRTIPRKTASEITLRSCPGEEAWLSTQFSALSEQRTSKEGRDTFPRD